METLAELPEGWRVVDGLEDTTRVGELEIKVAGWIAEHAELNLNVSGSAASCFEDPSPRARFELIERCVTVEARARGKSLPPLASVSGQLRLMPVDEVFPEPPSECCRFSLSNGVALGPSIEFAKRRAVAELVERDLMLRSWYGWLALTQSRAPEDPRIGALKPYYEFEFAVVQAEAHCLGVAVGWPRSAEAPLLLAHAAQSLPETAVSAALDEAIQRLGFLWGEEIPQTPPEFAPTPDFHQEYFLCPAHHHLLREWLGGKHFAEPAASQPPEAVGSPVLVNLEPNGPSGRHVVRAMGGGRIPLAFGEPLFAVPATMRVHPCS